MSEKEVELPVLTMPFKNAEDALEKLREGEKVELVVSPSDEIFIENLEQELKEKKEASQ